MKAALIRVALGDLRGERDELLARLDGCQDGDCPHHGDDLDRLGTVLWLIEGRAEKRGGAVKADQAEAVHARVRERHARCAPVDCALRRLWVEDVREIVEIIEALQLESVGAEEKTK